ncbi:MAG: 6-bladed beta-propeller [Bacteroidetes bacterium]|nr:6-bladed beta-propeller [Bacteroidota bacterium]
MIRFERWWAPDVLLLIGVVVFVGCTTKSDIDELQVSVRQAELTEVFRVGAAESDSAVVFGDIEDIGVNSDGHLLVADDDASVIYVFSESGDSLRTFGGPGLGPGEFESIRDMDIGPGDSVFVWDGRRGRLLIFEPETFQFSYDIEVKLSDDDRYASGLTLISDDLLLMRFSWSYSLSADEDEHTFNTLQFVSRDGRPVGEPVLRMPVTRDLLFRTESGIGLVLLPFSRRSSAKPGPDGTFYYGWSDSISFDVYSASGDLLRTVRYGHEAIPVTQQELNEWMQNKSEEAKQVVRREADIPKTKPAYSTFTVSDEGQIWVQHTPASDSLDVPWTVLGLDNQPVFRLELPPDVTVRVVKGNRVYATAKLEDGAPYVIAYEYD